MKNIISNIEMNRQQIKGPIWTYLTSYFSLWNQIQYLCRSS